MKELTKTDIYKFIIIIDNKSYFYTGKVQEETEEWIIINERDNGLMRLNKKFISTIYPVRSSKWETQ